MSEESVTGREWCVTRSPDNSNRVRKHAAADVHGRGSIQLPSFFFGNPTWKSYSLDKPNEATRTALLQQVLLVKILHTLYPSLVPNIYRIHTKHTPWHERDLVDGVDGLGASLTGRIGKDSRIDMHTFMKCNGVLNKVQDLLAPFGIHIDDEHEGNVMQREDGSWAYIDTFFMKNPAQTIGALSAKIATLQDPVKKHICSRWLRRLARISMTRT